MHRYSTLHSVSPFVRGRGVPVYKIKLVTSKLLLSGVIMSLLFPKALTGAAA
jgi:hypothetical protein